MRIKNVDKKELIEVVERFLANDNITIYDSVFLGEVFSNEELSDYSALVELVEILKGEVK